MLRLSTGSAKVPTTGNYRFRYTTLLTNISNGVNSAPSVSIGAVQPPIPFCMLVFWHINRLRSVSWKLGFASGLKSLKNDPRFMSSSAAKRAYQRRCGNGARQGVEFNDTGGMAPHHGVKRSIAIRGRRVTHCELLQATGAASTDISWNCPAA